MPLPVGELVREGSIKELPAARVAAEVPHDHNLVTDGLPALCLANPVRAKICDDPKDYRWCGYAEAVAGDKEARAAVTWLTALNPHGGMKPDAEAVKPKEALRRWRCHLFGIPESEEWCQAAAGTRRRFPR